MGLFNLFGNKKNSDIKYTDGQIYSIDPYELVFLIHQIDLEWDQPTYGGKLASLYDEYYFSDKTYNKLKKRKWIKPSDAFYSLKALKVTELREIAKEHNIQVKGKKEDIINTLKNNLSEEQIKELNLKPLIQATDLGNKIIECNPHIVYMDKNRQFFCCNFYEAHSIWKSIRLLDISFKDKLLGIIDKDVFNLYDLVFDENCIIYYETEAEKREIIRDIKRTWRDGAKDRYKEAVKKINSDFK